MHLWSFKVKCCFFCCAPERAVFKLRWYSYQCGHTALREAKKKSTCSFLLLIKDDTSVLEYPQDVHSREAKIYSPQHP